MSDEPNSLSAQERLAISRRALVEQLQGGKGKRPTTVVPPPGIESAPPTRTSALFDRMPWVAMARNVTERWWRRHPANAVGQLARPLLDRYARDQPLKLVAAAAGLGALAVVVRPWRLLSVTAVVAAVLKTSDVADMVNSLMHKRH